MAVESEDALSNKLDMSKASDDRANERILIGPVRIMIIFPATDEVSISAISLSLWSFYSYC